MGKVGGWFVNTFTGGALDDAEDAEREAAEREAESRAETDRLKEVYANMDISNPFANMKNEFDEFVEVLF